MDGHRRFGVTGSRLQVDSPSPWPADASRSSPEHRPRQAFAIRQEHLTLRGGPVTVRSNTEDDGRDFGVSHRCAARLRTACTGEVHRGFDPSPKPRCALSRLRTREYPIAFVRSRVHNRPWFSHPHRSNSGTVTWGLPIRGSRATFAVMTGSWDGSSGLANVAQRAAPLPPSRHPAHRHLSPDRATPFCEVET